MQGQQRRSVLGQVSSSRLNSLGGGGIHSTAGKGPAKKKAMSSRVSLGPGTLPRYSLGGSVMSTAMKQKQKKSQVAKRMSMMPAVGGGAAGRRQSTMSVASRRKSTATMGGGGVGAMLKSDPRPISDKAFRGQSIETLIRFLADHNYDQALSPKILHRPTGKDFEHIIVFLFRLFDSNRKYQGKFADEVTLMFKGLKYPFNISKTSLAAVGSPHTWPALLASLVWLVELLEYEEMTGLSEEEMPYSSEDDIDRAFFTYLHKAYQCFLSGDDNRYEELDGEMVAMFQQRDGEIAKQIEDLQGKNASLEKHHEEEAELGSLIPELERRKRDFQSDQMKWDRLIRQFEQNKEIILSKIREKEEECREKQAELDDVQVEKDRIQAVLDQQELSPADAERMNQERRSLNEALNQVLEQRDEIEKETWGSEMAISKRTQCIEEMVEKYNQIAQSLRIVQTGSSEGNIRLRLDPAQCSLVWNSEDGTQGATVDLSQIRVALENLRELSQEKTHQIRTSNMELEAQAEQNEAEQEVVRSQIRALEQQIEEAEARLSKDRAEMEEELAKRAEETEAVEEEIHRLRTEAEATTFPLEQSKKDLAALQASIEQDAETHLEALVKVDSDLSTAIDAFCAYKEQVQDILRDHEEKLKGKLEKAENSCQQHAEFF